MKQSKLLPIEILVYLIQIFLMITLKRYMQNNSFYLYFLFSFIYNLLLSISFLDTKYFYVKIIILNIFFTITIYFFGNNSFILCKDIWRVFESICFNTIIFLMFGANWMLSFIIRDLFGERL